METELEIGAGCALLLVLVFLSTVDVAFGQLSDVGLRRLTGEREERPSASVMQEVTAVSDRIIVIAGGRLVAQGTADELLQQAGRESLEDAFLALVGVEAGSHS